MPVITSRTRKAAALGVGLVLLAAVVRSGLGHGLIPVDPALAVRISGGNGMALGAASDRAMKTSQTEDDVKTVTSLSRQALLASPLEAAALRNLGFIAAINNREDDADKLLSLTGRLSKRDYFTHAWLLDKRFREGRIADAVTEADIVLRQRASTWPVIIPELVRLSNDARILKPMTEALARRPVWRSTYLTTLGQKSTDLKSAYAQLRLLRATSAPPNVDELRTYFARFDGSTNADRLWSEWLALTPDADPRATIRNGGFERFDAPPPFAWTLFPKDGVYAEQSKRPSGSGQSLYVSYEGGRAVGFAQQSLKLAPGSYRLTAQIFADEPVQPDQILIEMGCGSISQPKPIGSSFLKPSVGRWSPATMSFRIDEACALQQLRINGALGDFRQRASLWIDDIAIARVSPKSPR
jgi:hypothetical protein